MSDKTVKPTDQTADDKAVETAASNAEPAATTDTPSPTQAELDAIRKGALGTSPRKREVKSDGAKADYKTR